MNPLDELYAELDRVEAMTEAQVMTAYNADSKGEIMDLIREDIESFENTHRRYYPAEHPDHDDDNEDELEEERMQICLSQGLTRYC